MLINNGINIIYFPSYTGFAILNNSYFLPLTVHQITNKSETFVVASLFGYSLLRRGFCFLKNRGKEGKAEKRERRKKGKGGRTGKTEKAREKGKSEESLCQISVEIWRPPGGWLCTAMPACWAVEQRILKMALLNFKNPNK